MLRIIALHCGNALTVESNLIRLIELSKVGMRIGTETEKDVDVQVGCVFVSRD